MDEIEGLKAQVAALSAEVAALRRDRSGDRSPAPVISGVVPMVDELPVSRRRALRTAGLLTAGAVAGGAGLLASATPAAAVSGNFDGSPAVIANAGSGSNAIGVIAQVQGTNGKAIDAESTGNDGIAVFAVADNTGGIAVRADGAMCAVYGTSTSSIAILGRTSGDNPAISGVSATSSGNNAIGVRGTSDGGVGVYGSGLRSGVRGYSVDGSGVDGFGNTGGSFTGDIVGIEVSASQTHLRFSPIAAPTTTTRAHLKGDVVVDTTGVLWICTAAGSPGSWLQVGGATTAGAFHALTPGRVYDSRVGAPAPGPMSPSSASRTISVANKINSSTGGIVTSNFVPTGATAVFANVTIADTTTSGYLAINPGGVTTRDASTINWAGDGLAIANGVVLTLNASRQVTIMQGGPGSANVLIDVIGYYR